MTPDTTPQSDASHRLGWMLCHVGILEALSYVRMLFVFLILLFSEAVSAGQYSHLIYQESGDAVSALKFVGVPDEKIEKLIPRIRGELARQELINFAYQIIESRETKNVELIKRLTDKESIEHSTDMLKNVTQQIQDGSFIYGNNNFKYFVTSRPISDRMLTRYFDNNINKPSVTLFFYHYHPSNGALIGTQMFLRDTENGYKSVLPIQIDKTRHNNTPKPSQ